MLLPRLIDRVLARWRAASRTTTATTPHTVERAKAERTERRAQWAYEDESIRQHGSHGIEESRPHRINRVNARTAAVTRETPTDQERADEAEIERELRPSR
jgi:hypothetical protein